MDGDEEVSAFDKRVGELEAAVQCLTPAEALTYLQNLVTRWKLDDPPLDFRETIALQFENFGVDVRDTVDMTQVHPDLTALFREMKYQEMEAVALYHRLRVLELLKDDDGLRTKMRGVMEALYYAKRAVVCVFQSKICERKVHMNLAYELDKDIDEELGSWALRYRWVTEDLTEVQKVLVHVLDAAMELRYRKQDGMCFEPIRVNGYETHAYRAKEELMEFVYRYCTKELHYDHWVSLTSSASNVKAVVDYLTNCNDYQFPNLKKSRTVFAFTTGVYLAHEDFLYEFGSTPPLSDAVVAAKFFDLELPLEPLRLAGHWRDIPTPHLDSILEYQRFPQDVIDWMYVLIGRLLYPLNERDGWQVIPFLKGQAGSGKCFGWGTRILMDDGVARPVQSIAVGDRVMGEDGTSLTVSAVTNGVEKLFEVRPFGLKVTGQHVLCLKYVPHAGFAAGTMTYYCPASLRLVTRPVGRYLSDKDRCMDTFEMTVAQFLRLDAYTQRQCRFYRVGLGEHVLALPCLAERRAILAGFKKNYTPFSDEFLQLSLTEGYETLRFEICPSEHKQEQYFGFQVYGTKKRFLLADGLLVTHNSTIIKVCKDLYDTVDVGVLSNNIEKQFGLGAFYDKLIFVAPEIKSDLKIEQAEFQSIVSGEDVQLAIKHKKAFGTRWEVPGVLAGNEVPAWADNAGSIQRRICVFSFDRPVQRGDMRLGQKLEAEMAHILVKANRAYLEASGRFGSENIWAVLPPYFLRTRDQLAQTVNSVEAFLASGDVELGEDLVMPFNDFKNALKAFEISNGYKTTKYVADFFAGPFAKANIIRDNGAYVYRGRRQRGEHLRGVDLTGSGPMDDDDAGALG